MFLIFVAEVRPDSPVLERLEEDLNSIHQQIKDSILEQKALEEERAVKAIEENPRYFYSYAKKAAKSKSRVGPLFDTQGKLQKDPKTMANLLQDQYAEVFSNPDNDSKKIPSSSDRSKVQIADIEFSQTDIEKAIDDIKENSACGEEVLKRCKQN